MVISAEAAVLLESLAARQARIAAWTRCPQCGALVWAGVKRRAEAVLLLGAVPDEGLEVAAGRQRVGSGL
ncbi:hypothetical protein GCM10009734_24810 [Nonomuraea bangladeshensis]